MVTAGTNKDCTCPPMWPLEHVGAHHPKCLLRSKPVTGPDGDNPITDEQIRELRQAIAGRVFPAAGMAHTGLSELWHDTDVALGLDACIESGYSSTPQERSEARSRCAAAWNARHGGSQ